eukprot:scaffold275186_cov27-Tisochrysis_lutea.AAC.1
MGLLNHAPMQPSRQHLAGEPCRVLETLPELDKSFDIGHKQIGTRGLCKDTIWVTQEAACISICKEACHELVDLFTTENLLKSEKSAQCRRRQGA